MIVYAKKFMLVISILGLKLFFEVRKKFSLLFDLLGCSIMYLVKYVMKEEVLSPLKY